MNQVNQESGLFILGKPYKIPGEDREALKYFRIFSGTSVLISILRMKFVSLYLILRGNLSNTCMHCAQDHMPEMKFKY